MAKPSSTFFSLIRTCLQCKNKTRLNVQIDHQKYFFSDALYKIFNIFLGFLSRLFFIFIVKIKNKQINSWYAAHNLLILREKKISCNGQLKKKCDGQKD